MDDNPYISNTPHQVRTMTILILICCTLVAIPVGRAVAKLLGVD